MNVAQGIPSKTLEKAVEEKIEEMDLKQYCDRPAGGYSGGNKRKLSVAIAMIGDPQVIHLSVSSITIRRLRLGSGSFHSRKSLGRLQGWRRVLEEVAHVTEVLLASMTSGSFFLKFHCVIDKNSMNIFMR